MSWMSKFLFDPVKVALARLVGTSNPSTASAGAVALAAVQKLGTDATGGLVTVLAGSNSPAGVASVLVGDMENGLNATVHAYVSAAVPIIGPELADGAVAMLSMAEQHALTFVSALFQHHRETLVAAVAKLPPPAPKPVLA